VILQTVPYRATPHRDQSGAGVDEAVTTGSGDAILLTAGQQVPLRWAKPSDRVVTTFTDATGRTMRLPAGQTWVVLVPTGAGINVVNPTVVSGSGRTRVAQ
jgi:hypothetical protein